MAKILITGSADGLGSLAAQELIKEGHSVTLHARDEIRADAAMQKAPGAKHVVVGDLSELDEVKSLAEQVNALGRFDAIIYNAAIYTAPSELQFMVNTLAPYTLTALITPPKRLIYMSSGMHAGGQDRLDAIDRTSYSDSKLYVLLLAKAVARLWPEVCSNAVDPGWVPTKMGGSSAPDSLEGGYTTQVWLATSDDDKAKTSGHYFYHKMQANYAHIADDTKLQNKLLARCAELSGVAFPAAKALQKK